MESADKSEFLKKKELRLMLEFRDILREQSNFSRSINANSRKTRSITPSTVMSC